MTLHILPDLEQRSPEWHDQRRGLITASAVGRLITVRKLGALDFECPACGAAATRPCQSKVKPGEPIKTLHPERTPAPENKTTVIEPASNDESRGLTATLAAERISGNTDPVFVSNDMMRGVFDEPLAVDAYAEHYQVPVQSVGFMVKDFGDFRLGYSPDGLVGDDGLIEVKSRRQKRHLLTVVTDSVPVENMAQIQAGLLVSGRDWLDYISFCSGMRLYVKRVRPDMRWQKAITEACRQFEANARGLIGMYSESVAGFPMTERINYDMELVI